MKRLLALALFAPIALFATTAQSASNGIIGEWITPNGSIVNVYHCGSDVCLKLVAVGNKVPSLVDEENPNPALRTRPLCGLEIGTAFHLTNPDHAEGGKLYDPDSGNTYSGWMTSAGNTLTLRGYVGIPIFGRTELWTRAQTRAAPCQG